MKKIIDFIVYSNLFIAVCTALFTWQTLLIFPTNHIDGAGFIIINFISTFILYNLQRLYYSAGSGDEKYRWYNNNRRLIFTLITLLIGVSFNFTWHFFSGNIKTFVAYIILGAFSLLYFLPPIQLRRFGILKPFFISLVFVTVGILIPIDFLMDKQSVFYTLSQFVFIAALCVLFDIRDIDQDQNKNIITLPVKIGLSKTKLFVYFLLLIYLIFSALQQNAILMVSAIVTFIVSCTLTFFSNSKRSNFFYAVLVDGVIVLQTIITLLQL